MAEQGAANLQGVDKQESSIIHPRRCRPFHGRRRDSLHW